MILPSVAERINREFHQDCVGCGEDKTCRWQVSPAGVSGNSWGANGLMDVNTLPEVPAGGISPNNKVARARAGLVAGR